MIQMKNWSSYQSYKDRRPPWIRFHKTLLDNYEYQSMTTESRALLPMLWLLASEDKDPTSGLIQVGIDKIAFRLRTSKKIIESSLEELQVNDFIERISSVTQPLQKRNEIVPSETETETETETENRVSVVKKTRQFQPPTIPEIQAYIQEKNYQVDAEKFWLFYDSKNWMIGKNKMQKWKSAVATWNKNNDGSKSSIASIGRIR